MKSILAAIDFSDVSSAVVDKAAELAKSFSSKLWLIHVAAPDPDFVGYATGPQCERDWRAKVLRREHHYLHNKATELDNSGIDITPLLVQGATVKTILKEASKLKVDLLVVGSHGHSGLYKALVGSVSEGLIRRASCPILIVPVHKPHLL